MFRDHRYGRTYLITEMPSFQNIYEALSYTITQQL